MSRKKPIDNPFLHEFPNTQLRVSKNKPLYMEGLNKDFNKPFTNLYL